MFKNMRLSTKLISGYVGIALIIVFVAVLGHGYMKTINARMASMYDDRVVCLGQLGRSEIALYRIRGDIFKFVSEPQERSKLEKEIAGSVATINREFQEYRATYLIPVEKEWLDKFDPAWAAYQKALEDTLALVRSGHDKAAMQNLMTGGTVATARASVAEALDKLFSIQIPTAEEEKKAGNQAFSTATNVMFAAGGIGLLLAVSLGIILSRRVTVPIARTVHMLQEMGQGHLGERLGMDSRDEIGIMAKTIDQFAEDLQNMVRTTQKIAAGDLSTEVVAKDNRDEISPALKETIDSLRSLITESKMLTQAAIDGKLATRGDIEKFKGGYREIVKGVNETLDAVVNPLNVAAVYVERISKGDIPPTIVEEYRGDFNGIKNSLNVLIEAMNEISRVASEISDGKLNVDVKIRSEKDLLAKSINAMIKTMKDLLLETENLTRAVQDGRLDTRGSTTAYQGAWGDLVGGINKLINAFVAPINVTASYVDRISKGDMPPKITDEYRGDFNEIKNNLNAMIENLTRFALEAQSSADQVTIGSHEMSTGSEQLSEGATEQSASVEEVSSSMEEMAANIKQNSENAQQCENIALKAAEDAKQGGKAVSETVSAMKVIAGKISIIEEIARQTNLLALNAAIEAARAGEHGKGFAVVASEVRKLAERSQEAAAEINDLAGSSVEVAENAGSMLIRMVPDIQKTADLVQEISAACNEQSSGAAQINKAIQQLDQVIQQNAAAAEEMASTSTELLSQAEQLQNAVGFFKLGAGGSNSAGRSTIIVQQMRNKGRPLQVPRPGSAGQRQIDTGRVRRGPVVPAKADRSDSTTGGASLNMDVDGHGDRVDMDFERY